MRIEVITPEHTAPNEVSMAQRLFQAGLQVLHLRKPGYTTEEYRQYIEQIDTAFRNRIVLHGAYPIAPMLGVAGIHINEPRRQSGDYPMLNREYMSTSCHHWETITEVAPLFGRVFISPLFDSISKAGYAATTAVDGIEDTRTQLGAQCPQIVGLGGITTANIALLKSMGYDGAATLGAIWQAPDPVAMLVQMMTIAE